jgi:hypothetical protein
MMDARLARLEAVSGLHVRKPISICALPFSYPHWQLVFQFHTPVFSLFDGAPAILMYRSVCPVAFLRFACMWALQRHFYMLACSSLGHKLVYCRRSKPVLHRLRFVVLYTTTHVFLAVSQMSLWIQREYQLEPPAASISRDNAIAEYLKFLDLSHTSSCHQNPLQPFCFCSRNPSRCVTCPVLFRLWTKVTLMSLLLSYNSLRPCHPLPLLKTVPLTTRCRRHTLPMWQ